MSIVRFCIFFKNVQIHTCHLIFKGTAEEVEFRNYCDKCSDLICDCYNEIKNCGNPCSQLSVRMDGYLCSLFFHVLQSSAPYRTCFVRFIKTTWNHLNDKTLDDSSVCLCIKLIPPKQDIIDYKGNEMFEISCLERRELDNTMAWLSTLGGAFSALGDSMENCAAIAGKISLRQLEIALRLGDPYLIARCKLYMALSLIQRNKFKKAKLLIKEQYLIATQGVIKDNKLKSMCLGIWAKLKYDRNKKKQLQKRVSY